MEAKILVAGGTGDVGQRIVKALRAKNTKVVAPVRPGTDPKKIAALKDLGATVVKVDPTDVDAMTKACEGVSCLVSALAGLSDVIVGIQSAWLEAALTAKVPRFIPSDYSIDFTSIPDGENRNFDLRKEFHKKLDTSGIRYTSVFNGAFSDILAYNTPVYNVKDSTVSIWGDTADWPVAFTTRDDTAAFTAEVALDDAAPDKLHIAGFQVTPNELVALGTKLKNKPFKLVQAGTLEQLSAYNKKERAAHPEGEKELYPNWQNSQYMYCMFIVKADQLNNDRYPGLHWTGVTAILSKI